MPLTDRGIDVFPSISVKCLYPLHIIYIYIYIYIYIIYIYIYISDLVDDGLVLDDGLMYVVQIYIYIYIYGHIYTHTHMTLDCLCSGNKFATPIDEKALKPL